MKTINEDPYDFFQQGGWSFLGGAGGGEEVRDLGSQLRVSFFLTAAVHYQSDADDDSESESEFEAESDAVESSESSQDGSDYYDGSDASDDEGSGSDFGSDESEGLCAI